MNYYPAEFPVDALTYVVSYLRKDPDHDLATAAESAYALQGYAMKMLIRNAPEGNKPQIWGLRNARKLVWKDDKYALRLEQLMLARDADLAATSFPWQLVLEIVWNLIRVLLSR